MAKLTKEDIKAISKASGMNFWASDSGRASMDLTLKAIVDNEEYTRSHSIDLTGRIYVESFDTPDSAWLSYVESETVKMLGGMLKADDDVTVVFKRLATVTGTRADYSGEHDWVTDHVYLDIERGEKTQRVTIALKVSKKSNSAIIRVKDRQPEETPAAA